MLSSPFPFFSGGHTELTASMLNDMLEQMRRQSRLVPAHPVLVNRSGEGWQIRVAGVRGVFALAGTRQSDGRYPWVEAQLTPTGWAEHPSGRSGAGPTAAAEANGRIDVTAGEIIFVTIDRDRAGFVAPTPPEDAPQVVWARLDSVLGTRYGWTEMTYDPASGAFAERVGGDVVSAGEPGAAVEAGGVTAPLGSLVVLFRPHPSNGHQTAQFEYGGSEPGFWAVLLREFKGPEYTVSLGGATGGTWAVTFDPGDGAPPGTAAGSVTLAATASAADVGDALRPLTGGDVAFDGSTFVCGGAFAGDSGASLSAAGGELTGGTEEFAFEQTVVGRDLPFTDGLGRYAWVEAEFDAAGRLRPRTGGTGSVWPTALALEANGVATVPEGAVVWVTPRSGGFVRKPEVGTDPFTDWTQEELDLHLAGADLGDGWLTDGGVNFFWLGAASFWAELTDGPDSGTGLYPFRAVHLGGRDPEETATDDEGDEEEEDDEEGDEDTDTAAADALRAEYLSGERGAVFGFDAPLAESDRAWVATRPGGREVTGLAREVVGRTGFSVGTVVRVHVTPVTGGVEFSFSGPPLSLWATLGAFADGAYPWTELDPPTDPLTGEPRDPRTGTASEETGREDVTDGAAVHVYPDGSGGWRFRYQTVAPDADRECRLLAIDADGAATIVAGYGDPDDDGQSVDVRFLPERGAYTITPGLHVGYRAPGLSYYVVPNPTDAHNDFVGGYCTTGPQGIAGVPLLTGGSLAVTGSGGTPPFEPAVFYRCNPITDVHEVYTPGWMPVKADGSLEMSAGPRLVATATALDLQGGAVWSRQSEATRTSGERTQFRLNTPVRDGPTGTYTIAGIGAADGSITFAGGLYVTHTDPAPRPAAWSGTFLMYDLAFGVDRTVTVTDGVVSAIS